MKNRLVLLIALLSLSRTWAEQRHHPVCNERCETKQDCSNPIPLSTSGGEVTITKSGAYSLGNDLTTYIKIVANDVCLDLQCHTLTGKVGKPAIEIIGKVGDPLKNITIKNGSITHPAGTGIKASYVDGITYSNLTFYPVKEAIDTDHAKNICLKNVTANGNKNDTGKIISIANSEIVTLDKVELCGNILDRPMDTSLPNSGMLIISGTCHVAMNCCKVNKNICNDTFYFDPFGYDSGNHLKVTNCEFDYNGSFAPTSEGVAAACLSMANHVTFKRCTFNGTFAQKSSAVYGCVSQTVNHSEFDCCEANNTTIRVAPGVPEVLGTAGARGFFFTASNYGCMTRCQAHHTTHEKNTCTVPNIINGPAGVELICSTHFNFKKSSFNESIIDSIDTTGCSGVHHVAFGHLLNLSDYYNIEECNATGSSSDDAAFGFALLGATTVTYCRCKATHNKAKGTAAGFVALVGTNHLTYHECCGNNNDAEQGFGFAFEVSDYTTVQHCKADHNSDDGFFWGPCFSGDASNSNIKILDNCSQDNGDNGFLIDGSHPSFADNFIIIKNKALDNEECGFKVEPGTVNFDSTWLANIAEGNGTNYCLDFTIPITATKKGGFCCKEKSGCKPIDFSNIKFCSDAHTHTQGDHNEPV